MTLLTIIILVTTLANIAALYAHYWLLARAMRHEHEHILDEIAGVFAAPGEGQPSVFACITAQIIDAFAVRVTAQIKTSLMGSASAAAREGREVLTAMTQDANPMLGGLADAFPALGKILRKRPETLAALSQALSRVGGISPGGNGSGPSTSYNPSKYK